MTITLPEHIIFFVWLLAYTTCAMPLGSLIVYLAMLRAIPWADQRARNKRLEQLLKERGGPEA